MDLSNYVRVGRYDLPEPARTTADRPLPSGPRVERRNLPLPRELRQSATTDGARKILSRAFDRPMLRFPRGPCLCMSFAVPGIAERLVGL